MYRRTISSDISIALQIHSHAKELFLITEKNRAVLSKIFPHIVESEDEMKRKITDKLFAKSKHRVYIFDKEALKKILSLKR